jgi:hypothetical protein
LKTQAILQHRSKKGQSACRSAAHLSKGAPGPAVDTRFVARCQWHKATDNGSSQASVAESTAALPPETGGSMPRYPIYTIGRDDHFWSDENIQCANDQDATQRAQQTMDGRDIELWERDRFVARLSSYLSRQ